MTLMKWDPIVAEVDPDWTPVVDVVEDADEILIRAELPGLEMKDVAVTTDDCVLTITGDRNLEREMDTENMHFMECSYGTFRRSFRLPTLVDVSSIRAEFKNGLLTVTLPKKEITKPHDIEVKRA